MNELKARHAYTLDEIEVICSRADGDEYYLKSEADKVIADLEENHKMEVEQLLIEIAELKAKIAQLEEDVAFWKAKAKGEM